MSSPAASPARAPLRVTLVDPSSSTPPYDHLLAAALARAGARVELLTSRFLYGSVPDPDGYTASLPFYRRSTDLGLGSRLRLPVKVLEHGPDMVRVRRRLARSDAEVVHWQWLTLPGADAYLIGPRRPAQPRVITLHYPLPRPAERRALRRQRRVLERFDAVVSHSEAGAERLRTDVGLDPDRVHVIPHGPLDYLVDLPGAAPLPAELEAVEAPVVLFFGLLRPYKGIDVLLDAFARIDPSAGAELWIAGMPRVPLEPLYELAERAPGTVRFLPRFIPDPEIPALMRRADVLALAYRDIEQSGVLNIGLAFAKPIILGDVGGFSEVGARGAARLVPPEDPDALAAALDELLGDPGKRAELAAAAERAVRGEFGWDAIAARTLSLYDGLRAGGR